MMIRSYDQRPNTEEPIVEMRLDAQCRSSNCTPETLKA
ncbi:hypothetical protein BofuT4_uP084310.1 [Botrytis cinerea T4]|uniref:Uncharacterized protein n=1 Tax=Botryotinia fuckeliana (strain T4) TaxID=999810 RepID=G2YJJ0_BOTF4|nr:hypothetical protein BofuT4_uP084310.1 [Botrytis cinerea T4]